MANTIPEEAKQQIRVGVEGAVNTGFTIDEAVDYIIEEAIPIIEKRAREEIIVEVEACSWLRGSKKRPCRIMFEDFWQALKEGKEKVIGNGHMRKMR
jgi:hypothetical protein